MENASKALIMAASVLIGVVILSLATYLYLSFSSSANEVQKQMEEGQLQQFNNKFTSYEDKKENLTIYDVITVTNLAIENNKYYGLSEFSNNNFYITVKLNNEELQKKSEDSLSKFLKDYESNLTKGTDAITGATVTKLKTYNCKVSFNSNTGRVNLVVFTEKTWKKK